MSQMEIRMWFVYSFWQVTNSFTKLVMQNPAREVANENVLFYDNDS